MIWFLECFPHDSFCVQTLILRCQILREGEGDNGSIAKTKIMEKVAIFENKTWRGPIFDKILYLFHLTKLAEIFKEKQWVENVWNSKGNAEHFS